MIPGFPSPIMGGGGRSVSLTLTAGTFGGFIDGYISPTYASLGGFPQFGSLTSTAVFGGVIHGVASSDEGGGDYVSQLIVSDNTPALSEISIDGVPYPLIYDGSADGFTGYSFGGTSQIIASPGTYAITIRE